MQIGDRVKPLRFPNARTGVVRIVEDGKVAVQWVMRSGWKHTSWYGVDELETID